jgi:hypothetical protein
MFTQVEASCTDQSVSLKNLFGTENTKRVVSVGSPQGISRGLPTVDTL